MHPLFTEWVRTETRRQFFTRGANALGMAALASLMGEGAQPAFGATAGLPSELCRRGGVRTFAPKAKHVIYLHMVGGPSQMDLFDYKPQMQEYYDKDLPDSDADGPAA